MSIAVKFCYVQWWDCHLHRMMAARSIPPRRKSESIHRQHIFHLRKGSIQNKEMSAVYRKISADHPPAGKRVSSPKREPPFLTNRRPRKRDGGGGRSLSHFSYPLARSPLKETTNLHWRWRVGVLQRVSLSTLYSVRYSNALVFGSQLCPTTIPTAISLPPLGGSRCLQNRFEKSTGVRVWCDLRYLWPFRHQW